MRTLLATLVCASMLQSCTSSLKLTEEERQKLDPRLHFLFDEETRAIPVNIEATTQPDGTVLAGVIIHCSQPEDLRFLGDKVRTTVGQLVTAKLGKQDLKRVLQIASVKYVEASTIQHPK